MTALFAGRGVEVRSDAIIAALVLKSQGTMTARTSEGTGPGHHRTKMTTGDLGMTVNICVLSFFHYNLHTLRKM